MFHLFELPQRDAHELMLPSVVGFQKEKSLRASLQNGKGCCWRAKDVMARREEGEYPHGSLTDEQRSQRVFCSPTRRAGPLLTMTSLAHLHRSLQTCSGSPPPPPLKLSPAAPLPVFKTRPGHL